MTRAMLLAVGLSVAALAAQAADDTRQLSFGSQRFDPIEEAADFRPGSNSSEGKALRLVQFHSSPTERSIEQLSAAGLRVLQYYPNNAYLVWGDAQAAGQAESLSDVRWQGVMSPDWKQAPELKGRQGAINNLAVLVYDDGQLATVLVRIAGMGGAIQSYAPAQPDRALYSVIVGMDSSRLGALGELPQVLWFEYASPEAKFDDEQSSQIVGGNYNAANQVIGTGYIDFLNTLGLNGAGVTFAVTDTGIDYDNPELASRIVGGHDYPGCTSANGRPGDDKDTGGHGTHVAGIIAGAGVVAGGTDAGGYHYGIGVAPATSLVALNPICGGAGGSWPPAGGWQELSKRALSLGAIGSNNSWTSGEGTGIGYNASARTMDFIVRDGDFDTAATSEPFLLVFSAGNSGSGASTVTAPKEAKNIIATGNSLSQRAGSINSMSTSSSRGPAVDGRVLPTVSAPGSTIASTRRVNGASQCATAIGAGVLANYAFCSGTSMASPQVAGLSVLLTQWWRQENGGDSPSPAMIKALLVNGAVDMAAGGAVPNNAQGWGRVHLPNSIGVGLERVYVDQAEILDTAGEVYERSYGVPDTGKPVRLTLVWTDAPGAPGANPALVNNLDLEVVAGGQTYRGNVFSGGSSATGGVADTRANTENVYLPAGISDVLVRVRATALPGDGVPGSGDATDQDFALICSNCASVPSFTLNAPALPASSCAGTQIAGSIDLGQILGFTGSVALSASGLPAPGTVSFTPNPVTSLPGSAQFAISTTGVAGGDYSLVMTGTSGSVVRNLSRSLFLADAAPGAASLTSPANGAVGVPLNATFSWQAAAQAFDYQVQIALDTGFQNIIAETSTRSTDWTPTLPSNTQLYWRVIANNACALGFDVFIDGFEATPTPIMGGGGTVSATGSFSTAALPGDCPVGTSVNTIFNETMETGAGPLPTGWTGAAAAGSNSWTMNTFAPRNGLRGLQGLTPASASDQRVETPAIAVPASGGPTSLVFWQQHDMESRTGGCWDGGFLEVSVGAGAFTAVNAGIANPAYDGPLGSGNPAAPQAAWCGTRAFQRTAVDLQPYAGQSVRLRFRLTSDGSVNRPNGWMIDDVTVQQCVTP